MWTNLTIILSDKFDNDYFVHLCLTIKFYVTEFCPLWMGTVEAAIFCSFDAYSGKSWHYRYSVVCQCCYLVDLSMISICSHVCICSSLLLIHYTYTWCNNILIYMPNNAVSWFSVQFFARSPTITSSSSSCLGMLHHSVHHDYLYNFVISFGIAIQASSLYLWPSLQGALNCIEIQGHH